MSERLTLAYVACHVSPFVRSSAGQSQEAQATTSPFKAAAIAAVSIADLKAKVVFNPAMLMGGPPPKFPKPSTPAEPAAAATEPAQGILLRR